MEFRFQYPTDNGVNLTLGFCPDMILVEFDFMSIRICMQFGLYFYVIVTNFANAFYRYIMAQAIVVVT